MRLRDRVAVITGASCGIGRADARLFAEHGAKVAIADIDDAGAQETVAAIARAGGEAASWHTDVTRANEVERFIDEVVDRFSQIDVVINNVGMPQELHEIENTDEKLWDKVHDVNLKSVFITCKAIVPVMKNQGSGSIINMSTVNSLRPHGLHCAVSSAKSSVIALTKALAMELAPYNIRVNCISPWTIDTPSFRGSLTEEQQKTWMAQIPLGRIGKPEDIAYAALYLASDESSWVTGVNLPVDGGYAA